MDTSHFKPGFERRFEGAGGRDTESVRARLLHDDGVRETGWCKVDKYDDDMTKFAANKLGLLAPQKRHFDQLKIKPYETLVVEGNLLTTQGLGKLTDALIGTGSLVLITATTTRIGVGSVATAATAADTALGGNGSSSTAWYQIVDSAPTRVTTTVTNDSVQAVSTFASGDGNFAWQEWGINTSTATPASTASAIAGTFWNHKIASLGTKTAGASWALTVKIAFS